MERSPDEPTLLADILYPFLDKVLAKSDQWFALKLWQCWPELATTDIMKKSRPVSFQNGRLLLWVNHSVELMELSFHLEELKTTINSRFGQNRVRDIHWTLNKDVLEKRKKSTKVLQKIFSKGKL